MSESPPPVAPAVRRRPLRLILRLVAGLLAVIALGLGWLLGTESGLQTLAAHLPGLSAGTVSIGQAHGRLLGPLDLHDIRYDDGHGTRVQLRQLQLDWRPLALLRGRLHILRLQTGASSVALVSQPETAPAPSTPFEMPEKAPFGLRIDQLQLGPVDLQQDGKSLLKTRRLDLAGSWLGHQLTLARLDLDAEPGQASLHGQVRLGKVIRGRLQAQVQWQLGEQALAATLDAHAADADAHLDLDLTAPTAAHLQLQINQLQRHAWQGQLNMPPAMLAKLGLDGPIKQLALELDASGDDQGGQARGRLDLDQIPILLDPLQLGYQPASQLLDIRQLHLHSPKLAGIIDLNGQLGLGGSEPSGHLALHWQDLALPADWVGQAMTSAGQLKLDGGASQFAAAGQLDLGPAGRLAHLQLDLQGSPQHLDIRQLDIRQQGRDGHLQARGQVDLQPTTRWNLQLAAKDFDPGVWLHDWPGSLNLKLDTEGQLAGDLPVARLHLDQLQGRLRDRPISGKGQLQLDPQQVLSGQLNLASGQSRIRLEGQPGRSNQLRLELSAPQANDWLPEARGRLNAQARYQGKLQSGQLQLQLHGEGLSYQDNHIGTLGLDADVPDVSRIGGKISLRAANAKASGLAVSRLAVDADGNEKHHRLQLQLTGKPLSAELQARGSYRQSQWQGQLSQLHLDLQGLPRWSLQKPVDLRYADAGFRSSELCLVAGEPRICASASQNAKTGLDASYHLHALPLAMLLNAAGMADLPVSISGILEGDGKIHRSPAGQLDGQATIHAPGGQIHYLEQPDQPLINYGPVQLQARLQPRNQQLNLHAQFSDASHDQGHIDGQVQLHPVTQALTGELAFALPSLNFVSMLSPQLAAVHGHAQGRLRLGGKLDHPTVVGEAALQDFGAEVPVAGIKLEQGQLALNMLPDGQASLQGQLKSGSGSLQIQGQLGLDSHSPSHVSIRGSQFTAADIPAAKVTISPDLSIDYLPTGLKLGGSLKLDTAAIDISKLPGAGAQQASSDVVVLGAPPVQADPGLPISAQVLVDLGKHTDLTGMGLDGHLSGQLTVLQTPGHDPVGQGQITVDGTYKAYGQNLSIEHGQVLFASTPLDNPGLNLQAIRKINTNLTVDDGQRVGLAITGTAQKPVINLYSNPAMDQSDVLSYMTTGKPLSQLNNGESSMVNSAAQALGSVAGNYLAKHIGSKLGIDEIGVSSSDALNGNSAFTVGKYLTPRLYLSYGIGLFESGQVVTLRYRISRRWNVEAQSATEFSRTSLNYRLER